MNVWDLKTKIPSGLQELPTRGGARGINIPFKILLLIRYSLLHTDSSIATLVSRRIGQQTFRCMESIRIRNEYCFVLYLLTHILLIPNVGARAASAVLVP